MARFGNEKAYNKEIISAFNKQDDPEILIVVDKLLTGFDAPRNTILYIVKPLKEHTLLQAIARVNRLHDGKDFGYIIDYTGVLGDLDSALTTYQALADFDEGDLEGAIADVTDEIKTLPQKYSELWDIFRSIKNRRDEEEYERLLFDEELRQNFYDKLSAYSRTLGIALSSTKFYEDTPDDRIQRYKDDLKFFQKLRASVKNRYSEVVDYKEYEARIQKLLDTHVKSEEPIRITELVNIFDKEEFEKEIEKIGGTAARADMIAHRTKKAIEEKFDEDPVFYQKFSTLLQQAIDLYQQQRLAEAEYYSRVKGIMEAVRDRKDTDTPQILEGKEVAKAFYGVAFDVIGSSVDDPESMRNVSAEVGIEIDDIILRNRIVDWHLKDNVQNKIKNEIEDYLADHDELKLGYDQIDLIMERILDIAKKRYAS